MRAPVVAQSLQAGTYRLLQLVPAPQFAALHRAWNRLLQSVQLRDSSAEQCDSNLAFLPLSKTREQQRESPAAAQVRKQSETQ